MTVFDSDNDHDEQLVRPYHSDVNRTILFVSMVSFATVFFLVFVLYLYARCVLRGRSRHRASIRRLTIAALHVSDFDAAAHRHAEPPSVGLDPAITESLPTFTVGAKLLKGGGGGGGRTSAVECAVCLSALEDEDKAKLLPNCNHFFHVDCIDTWLGFHSTCPLCRAEVKPLLKPQDREGPVLFSLDDIPIPISIDIHDGGNNNNDNGDDNGESSLKRNDSNSRLNSFRRILSKERSSRRIQPFGHEDGGVNQDLERE